MKKKNYEIDEETDEEEVKKETRIKILTSNKLLTKLQNQAKKNQTNTIFCISIMKSLYNKKRFATIYLSCYNNGSVH